MTTTRPLTPHIFITNTTTVRCLTLCRYRRMAMHRANLRTRRTAAVHRSQVSALLYLSCVSLPPLISTPSNPFKFIVPLVPSAPCSWSQVPYRWVTGTLCRQSSGRWRARRSEHNAVSLARDLPTGCTKTSTRSRRQVLTQWYIYLHEVRV